MGPLNAALALAGLAAATVLMWRVRAVPASVGAGSVDRVAVVIPCRNEAARLGPLLASLAGQTRPPDAVLVVDDQSTDDTAAVAVGAGAAVVPAGALPVGWAGKPWACHVGVAAATERAVDRLVLVDADTWLAPDGLARLTATHEATVPDGLLSVQPYHRTERAYEQLSAAANIVTVMASGLAAIRAPRSSAVAFGPCLVTTVAALSDVGGFAAVRADIVEDAALAACYRAAGRTVRCLAGADAVRFRMYGDGIGSLVAGWTKNLAGGAARADPAPTVGAVAWVAGALAVAAGLAIELSVAAFLLWALYAAQTAWMLRRLGRFRWWTSALFPVPVLAFVVLFAVSVVGRALGCSVAWRGRTVPIGGR